MPTSTDLIRNMQRLLVACGFTACLLIRVWFSIVLISGILLRRGVSYDKLKTVEAKTNCRNAGKERRYRILFFSGICTRQCNKSIVPQLGKGFYQVYNIIFPLTFNIRIGMPIAADVSSGKPTIVFTVIVGTEAHIRIYGTAPSPFMLYQWWWLWWYCFRW